MGVTKVTILVTLSGPAGVPVVVTCVSLLAASALGEPLWKPVCVCMRLCVPSAVIVAKSELKTYPPTYLPTDLPTYLPTNLPTYLPT